MSTLLSLIIPSVGVLAPFTEPTLDFWSPVIFWFVAINAILCGIFTLVVVVGGLFDLRFLFKALKEEVSDETDDGRVSADASSPAGGDGL